MNISPASESRASASRERPEYARNKKVMLILGLVVVILVLGVVAARSLSGNSMRAGPVADSQNFVTAKPGAKLSMVLEIQKIAPAADGATAEAAVLREDHQDSYLRTTAVIGVRWLSATKLIMGGMTDLKKGAVLQVMGEKNGADLDARQIVILTGYVVVK